MFFDVKFEISANFKTEKINSYDKIVPRDKVGDDES
jgi:hypothetical protein